MLKYKDLKIKMPNEEDLNKQIESLRENLKKTHEETAILNAIFRALKKLQEKREKKDELKQIANLEEQIKNL